MVIDSKLNNFIQNIKIYMIIQNKIKSNNLPIKDKIIFVIQ